MYGVAVTGMDPAELLAAQSFFLKLVGARGGSRSRSVSLAAHADPMWRQGLAPALLWSKIVWQASMDHTRANPYPLSRLLKLAQPILSRPPASWSQVRGPLVAAVLSFGRIGWSLHTPLIFQDPAGRRWHLTVFFPQILGLEASRAMGASERIDHRPENRPSV